MSDRIYLYHLPSQTEVEEWSADEPIQVVMVSDFFTFFLGDCYRVTQPIAQEQPVWGHFFP